MTCIEDSGGRQLVSGRLCHRNTKTRENPKVFSVSVPLFSAAWNTGLFWLVLRGCFAMNRILYAADCLDVLNDAAELPDESIDLIYLDPPFNSNSNYNLPFKGRDKSLKPVEAFKDTWEWTAADGGRLEEMESDPRTRSLAAIVRFAQEVEQGRGGRSRKPSLAAYLINMSLCLRAMRRVLKETGSIYLHCDPTAGHYLKLVMDAIYGRKNFRNEIVWCYRGASNSLSSFPKKHDIILFYAKSSAAHFQMPYLPMSDEARELFKHDDGDGRLYKKWSNHKTYLDKQKGRKPLSWWDDIPSFMTASSSKERLGYPTQKPLALLERIIKASSKPGDIVLDPFCGCGTTVHAAENLKRRWIGIDISPFAAGLIRERMVDNFRPALAKSDIVIRGIPHTIEDARALAQRDKFEFEKWVCGFIGAEGMFRQPGERGADGGVDGLLKFYRFVPKKVAKAEYAIVQVKGGKVSPDAVRALRETVSRLGVTAGVMVCFERYMRTVENQRSHDTFADVFGSYPVIQGYSIENLLANAPLDLPTYGHRRKGGLLDL